MMQCSSTGICGTSSGTSTSSFHDVFRRRFVTEPRPSRRSDRCERPRHFPRELIEGLSMLQQESINQSSHYHTKAETRLAYPGERLAPLSGVTREAPSLEAAKLSAPRFSTVDAAWLSDPFAGVVREEVRSLEIEREHNLGTEGWQRLRRDSRGDVVPSGTRVNKGLVSERLHEVEARCRGSRSNPWACD